MDVYHSTRIETIGRDAWDALAHDLPVVQYGWLRAWERSQQGGRKSVYWWVEDGQGLLAAVVGAVTPASVPGIAFDRHRFGQMTFLVRAVRAVLLPRPMPLLQCGAHCTPGNPLLIRSGMGAEEVAGPLEVLLESVEAHCRRHGWMLTLNGAFENDTAVRRLFEARRYLETPEPPGTELHLPFDSWAEYLGHLKLTHPATERNIRHQLNRGRRHGVTIELLGDPTVHKEEIHRLLAEHYARKNQTPYRLSPSFAANLERCMGDRALFFVARLGGRLIGVAVFLRQDSTMQGLLVGIDKEYVRSKSAVYFNLAFHQPIAWALESGCDRVVLGPMAYQIKTSRGARLVPLTSWLWQPNRLVALAQRMSASYAIHRQQKLLARFLKLNLPSG